MINLTNINPRQSNSTRNIQNFSLDFSSDEQGGKAIDGILNIWLKDENMGLMDAYLLKIQKSNLYQRTLRVSSSHQQLILPKLKLQTQRQTSQNQALSRTQSQYFNSRFLIEERQTPTQSERKKSVSFSDPLEEIYIVESFKTTRPKSADKYRRQQKYDRSFIIPYTKPPAQNQDIDIERDIISGSGFIAGLDNIDFQSNAPSILEIKSNIKNISINTCIKSPQGYNSNLPSKININSNLKDNSDKTILTPQPQRNSSTRLYNLLSNDSILVPDLPTINEVPLSNKNQFNSAKDNSQSHLSKLQKRYLNGATPIKSNNTKIQTNLYQNSSTMIQPYVNTNQQSMNQNQNLSNNGISNTKLDNTKIIVSNGQQNKHQYQPQKQQVQLDESSTNINKIIDKVFITANRVTRNSDKTSSLSNKIKDQISSHQGCSIKTTVSKTPIKSTTMLMTKSPRSKPIPVYQSSNSNNTSITTQSKSPNVKKENISLNSSMSKSNAKTRNPINKSSMAHKPGFISGSLIKLHLTSITPVKTTDRNAPIKVDSGLLNASNSFLRLHSQSIKNIKAKDQTSSKMVSPPQIDKQEIMDPNFFKRYLEVKSFISNNSQATNTQRTQNLQVTPQKTNQSYIDTLQNQSSKKLQQNLNSNYNVVKDELNEIKKQSDLFIGDKRPKSRNNISGISNTAQNIEINSSFQNTALKQFHNLTPKKQNKFDILQSIEYNHKQTTTLINERLNTLKMNSRKSYMSPNSSVIINKKNSQVDAMKKLQKKQQDFSFNQSSILVVQDAETLDKINESSCGQQFVDITPDKDMISSPKNQGKSINKVNSIRSKIQLNSCRSSGMIGLNRSLDFKAHKLNKN